MRSRKRRRPSAPSIQPARTVVASTCSNVSSVGAQYLQGGSGMPVRCGPQTQSPNGFQVTRRAAAPATAPLFGSPEVPASNPRGVVQVAPITPPSGYERVWGDGRLNPYRGLPRTAVQPAAAPVARISSRSVSPQVTAPAHRFVQVGTFSNAGNAQRAIQRFQSMGLPVSAGRSGSGNQIIAIGPVRSSSDLQRALQAARGAGFSDAFTRN